MAIVCDICESSYRIAVINGIFVTIGTAMVKKKLFTFQTGESLADAKIPFLWDTIANRDTTSRRPTERRFAEALWTCPRVFESPKENVQRVDAVQFASGTYSRRRTHSLTAIR